MTKTIVKHHTKSAYFGDIIHDNSIDLEGCGTENYIRHNPCGMMSQENRKVWKLLKKQYKLIGRYVWFTEEDHANCTNMHHDFKTFSFFAEDIAVEQWSIVRRRMIHKNGNPARKWIKMLEDCARAQGDNPELWWVATKPISLDHCLELRDVTPELRKAA